MLKITWNVNEINLHLMFNWDLNLIEVCATQSLLLKFKKYVDLQLFLEQSYDHHFKCK